MSNQSITLNVQKRTTGKANSRSLRAQKLIPAVVYGPKVDNMNLYLDELAVEKFSGHGFENAIFTLKSEEKGINGLSVLMKDVDVHPLTQRPVHVDFFALDMSETVRVAVEIKFEGKPVGVAEDGGLFQILLREVEVECLPKNIPDAITVDISGMALNESLHVSDLSFPTGVEAVTAGDLAIANVTMAKEEPAETAGAGEAAAPTEEKKD